MKRELLFLLTLACSAVLVSPAEAGFVKSYDFNGNLSDTLGNGLDLISGGGTVSGGRYHFGLNEGLTLNSAVTDTSNYAIEFRLRLDDNVAGYKKLVDFQELNSDDGLYVFEGSLIVYPESSTGGLLSAGIDYTVGLERSADVVRVFLDGSEVFQFTDSSSYTVSASNILNFFMDDIVTSQFESFAGSVDFIRIHDDASTFGQSPAAVPEPFSAAVWGTGLVAGVIARRRSRSKK